MIRKNKATGRAKYIAMQGHLTSVPYLAVQRWITPLFLLVYAFLSLYVLTIFSITNEFGTDWIGHETRPVAYRPLILNITTVLDWIVPEAVKDHARPYLLSAIESDLASALISRNYTEPAKLALSEPRIVWTAELLLVVYLTLLSSVWMVFALAKALLPGSPATVLIAPVLTLLLLSIFHGTYGYTYDYAELFFSAALLYLLFRQRWGLYLLCFALATYNKETSLFTIFFYFLFYASRLPRRRYIVLGVAQLALYAAIRAGIMHYYADLPSVFGDEGAYIHTWRENLLYLFTYNNFNDLVNLIVMVVLLTYRWWEKPLFLRAALWMLPANAAAYFLACHAGEYRDFLWCLPVLVILAAHSLACMAGFHKKQ
jgi:hypothetical protein